jgi:outer membrane biosynthesis protein TonB
MGLPVKLIELKVSIDETGKVVKAQALPLKAWTPQIMIQAALDAVRLWKFKPARKGNQSVPSEMVLQFAFKSPE